MSLQRTQKRRAAELGVEAVEKVSKEIFGRDAEKNDLIECATINDFILAKGQVTPKNIVLPGRNGPSCRLVRQWKAINI